MILISPLESVKVPEILTAPAPFTSNIVAVLEPLFTVSELKAVVPLPLIVALPEPVKDTVPLLCVNVPPLFVQLPVTLNVPVEPGALNEPLLKIRFVVIVLPAIPDNPVYAPPEIVRPPLNV